MTLCHITEMSYIHIFQGRHRVKRYFNIVIEVDIQISQTTVHLKGQKYKLKDLTIFNEPQMLDTTSSEITRALLVLQHITKIIARYHQYAPFIVAPFCVALLQQVLAMKHFHILTYFFLTF